jgi:RecA-family ATPase
LRDDTPIQNFVDGVTPWRPADDREPNPFEPENFADFLADPIPPREWLLGTLLCREYVTVLAASGGSGKTALNTVWALSLASGRPLVGLHVHKRCRVLVLTFEDGRTEYRRRFKAACLHHNIDPEEIGEFLFIKSLNGLGITLATSEREGVMIETDAPARIMDLIKRLEIDAVTLDPFVKCSGAPENDNVAVDAVARILARIAEQGNVAVAVSHHFRKGVVEAGNIDSARGARSLIDAARIALTLMPMSTEEANKAAIAMIEGLKGTYEVDEPNKALTMKIEYSSFPNFNGATQRREIKLENDELTIINTTAASGGTAYITWKRIK